MTSTYSLELLPFYSKSLAPCERDTALQLHRLDASTILCVLSFASCSVLAYQCTRYHTCHLPYGWDSSIPSLTSSYLLLKALTVICLWPPSPIKPVLRNCLAPRWRGLDAETRAAPFFPQHRAFESSQLELSITSTKYTEWFK